MKLKSTLGLAALWTIISLGLPQLTHAERIKDLSSVAGIRNNQLIGYGIVVGLDGTGDQTIQTPFTVQSLKSMLSQLGIRLPDNTNLQLKNVAAVMIHADLPPFAKPGSTIDITVGSLGNAKSLRGGSLLMAPLKGADGKTYAMAQGNLIVGGFGAATDDGSSISVNIPSVGRIPNGATVEREVPTAFLNTQHLRFNLHRADFTTATRMAQAIDESLGVGSAFAIDGSTIEVIAPVDPKQRVPFMAIVENITVDPATAPARVVVNSRSGTVVIGSKVRVTAAAVTHGSLTVTISNNPIVSQPEPLSGGATVVAPKKDIEVEEEQSRMFLFDPGVELNEIVDAVNNVGAAPGDLVAILEALKQAGALHAELIVI